MSINDNISINIGDYAARTDFHTHSMDIPFINTEEVVPIGLDVGYSSVKVYSIFGQHIFPALPIRVTEDFSMITDETDIKYKDEDGNIWYVGNLARTELEGGRIQAQAETLYGRQRVNSAEFLVLLRVGLFFGLIKEDKGSKFTLSKADKIKIKTGLPDQYINKDREALRDRFIGHHHYQVKVGEREWHKVSITIEQDDISVISQPFGTLWSLAANHYGELINRDLLEKNVLIFDGGQHTVDTYFNRAGLKGINSTWENLSMVEIIKNTRKDVRLATHGQGDFQNYAFDKLITSDTPGKVMYGRRQVYDMTNDILENTEKVAREAAKELDIVYDNLNDVDILVCAGGTGKVFYPYFKKHYNYEGLDVLLAERNSEKGTDRFTAVFANVVGFFNCLIAELREELDYDEISYEEESDAHEPHEEMA